jgi:hypothetical protein
LLSNYLIIREIPPPDNPEAIDPWEMIMRVFSPVNGTGHQAPTGAAGISQADPSAFQVRLAASGSAPASSLEGASPSGADILQHAMQEMRSLLKLQYQLAMGRDQLTSNLLKARHDTAKNAISNLR